MIVKNEPADSAIKAIVLHLAGLRTEMSFPSAIGYVITGSGLQEVLEVVYAENTDQHTLSGNSIFRAVKAHLRMDNVLNAMFLSASLEGPSASSEVSSRTQVNLNDVSKVYVHFHYSRERDKAM